VVFGFYVLSFVAVVITGLVFKRAYPSQEALVLELPPYRAPSLSTILRRGWTQMLNLMVTTRSFIVLGAAAIWLLTHLPPEAVQGSGVTIADWIGGLFQPLLAPIGMNPGLTVSLFFGFIAKEILLGAMAVIYKTSEADLGGVIGGNLCICEPFWHPSLPGWLRPEELVTRNLKQLLADKARSGPLTA
jgi:ferrous iron transport protein B